MTHDAQNNMLLDIFWDKYSLRVSKNRAHKT